MQEMTDSRNPAMCLRDRKEVRKSHSSLKILSGSSGMEFYEKPDCSNPDRTKSPQIDFCDIFYLPSKRKYKGRGKKNEISD